MQTDLGVEIFAENVERGRANVISMLDLAWAWVECECVLCDRMGVCVCV